MQIYTHLLTVAKQTLMSPDMLKYFHCVLYVSLLCTCLLAPEPVIYKIHISRECVLHLTLVPASSPTLMLSTDTGKAGVSPADASLATSKPHHSFASLMIYTPPLLTSTTHGHPSQIHFQRIKLQVKFVTLKHLFPEEGMFVLTIIVPNLLFKSSVLVPHQDKHLALILQFKSKVLLLC